MKALITLIAVLVVAALAFFLYSSPAAPPEMTEAEVAQHEAEVRGELTGAVDSYGDALLGGDTEAFMSSYAFDARVYWPGMNFDKAELQAFMEEFFQTVTWTGYDAELSDLFVHGDAAYAIWEVSETFQAEGQGPQSGISSCFTRFERVDGVWKVHRDVCGPRDALPEG